MDIFTVVGILCVVFVSILISLRWGDAKNNVAVLVVGDLGRSPRMQYHCMSLSHAGRRVQAVGYEGAKCPEAMRNHDKITITRLKGFGLRFPRPLFLLYAFLKISYQLAQLFHILLLIPRPAFLIVQNPPSIPTLFVAHIVCLLRGSRLVIDWHNFGYSILALNLGKSHLIVKISEWYEKLFGQGASVNFCVTKAMRNELQLNWGVTATVLYDCPPDKFRELSVQENHELFVRLTQEEPRVAELREWMDDAQQQASSSSIFTYIDKNGAHQLRKDRPALILSSTSWTEDEDFSILLRAIEQLDQTGNEIPKMVFIITGKGPMKEFYENKIKSLKLKKCFVLTLWLAAEDYPRLLGCADIGVSLHTSSSGIDLPMKVVDMFGCALPVCAIGFPALPELVRHGENGLVFDSCDTLREHMCELLTNKTGSFPENQNTLQQMRKRLRAAYSKDRRWQGNYQQHALPLLSV